MEWIDRGCTKENGMEDEIIEFHEVKFIISTTSRPVSVGL